MAAPTAVSEARRLLIHTIRQFKHDQATMLEVESAILTFESEVLAEKERKRK